ncbi:hypothetical protein P879_03416 [Paragonimus westermani]|uniref:Uncharacterized protein n=1 Tax=Paragonimus westermani TaxID=34504 RepID=A0A8T0DFE6_9TREM|nr:hypothetical protein P879_03416 [Paragonimus westermani]
MDGWLTNYEGQMMTYDIASKRSKVVPGLCAAGEVACSSNDCADRLGANSQRDLVVFERVCTMDSPEKSKPNGACPELKLKPGDTLIASLDKLRHASGSYSVADLHPEMPRTMQYYATVFRDCPVWQELQENVRFTQVRNVRLKDN